MAKDWEDGPDDEEEPPLTQRELLDVAIRWFETLNLATGAALTHLRVLRNEIGLRPVGKVLRMPERRADATGASGAAHSDGQTQPTVAGSATSSARSDGLAQATVAVSATGAARSEGQAGESDTTR